MPFDPPNANGEENDMLLGLGDIGMEEDMGEENMNMDLLMGDMFMWPANSPRASPRRHDDEASREGSPARNAHLTAAGAYQRDDDNQPVCINFFIFFTLVSFFINRYKNVHTSLKFSCVAGVDLVTIIRLNKRRP